MVKIDQRIRDADWTLTDDRSMRFEYPFDYGGKAGHACIGVACTDIAARRRRLLVDIAGHHS